MFGKLQFVDSQPETVEGSLASWLALDVEYVVFPLLSDRSESLNSTCLEMLALVELSFQLHISLE